MTQAPVMSTIVQEADRSGQPQLLVVTFFRLPKKVEPDQARYPYGSPGGSRASDHVGIACGSFWELLKKKKTNILGKSQSQENTQGALVSRLPSPVPAWYSIL